MAESAAALCARQPYFKTYILCFSNSLGKKLGLVRARVPSLSLSAFALSASSVALLYFPLFPR